MAPPLRSNLASALRSLRANGLRSALTMLGLAIGVSSVVLLVAIGEGIERDVRKQLDEIGSNLVVVIPGKLDPNGMPNLLSLAAASTLTEGDARALASLPGITECMPVMFLAGSVERDGQSYSALVAACTSQLPAILPRRVVEGRFFTAAEDHSPVCVLGYQPRRDVFGTGPAVGQTLSVRGIPYRVVGVLAPETTSLTGMVSFANVIFTPIGASRGHFAGAQVNRIVLKTGYGREPRLVLAAVRRTMLARHGGHEDFGVLTQEQILGAVYTVFNLLTVALAGISAVALVVAGVGVMNIMLVTVTERTREIGIRKAVGARRRDIFSQFLTEAVALCLLGGAAGVALAAAISAAVAAHTALKPVVTWHALALALGVCVGTGVVFGVMPALRAARQSPIDALRWE